MKYTFGDIVIVDGENLGVIVKSWIGLVGEKGIRHEVYVRMYNNIKEYKEEDIKRYLVRHKYLTDEEKKYQNNAEQDL